jgi:hypothetical protein
MQYNFIKLKSNGAYFNVLDYSQNSRFICFNSKDTATKYIKYACNYRSHNGYWNSINARDDKKIFKPHKNTKRRTSDNLESYLEIESFDEGDSIFTDSNISMIYCSVVDVVSLDNAPDIIGIVAHEIDFKPDAIRLKRRLWRLWR